MTAKQTRRRYRKDPLMAGSDSMPNAMAVWHMLGPLDEVARRMEAKWGIERLACLVPEQMARKFGAAREHLDNLLAGNDDGRDVLDEIAAAAENLRRGWEAMDAAATAAGAPTFDPIAWSLTVAGRPAAIVRDAAAAGHIQKMDPGRTVWTLEEVGNLLAVALGSAAPTIAEAKQAFPGAVASVRPAPSALAKELDDEIPF